MQRFRLSAFCGAALLYGALVWAPPRVVYAASSSTSYPSMGMAIGGVVAAVAAANGFSPADPRIAETVAAIGEAAAAAAATIAAGAGIAVGAVPWIAVAAVAAGGALLAVPTSLGNGSLQQWQSNSDGSVTVSGAGGSSPYPALAAPQQYFCVGNNTETGPGSACGSSVAAACQAFAQKENGTNGYTWVVGSSSSGSCSFDITLPQGGQETDVQNVTSSGTGAWSGNACSSGIIVNGSCASYSPPPPVTESVMAAAAATPAADDPDVLNAQVLAATVNALWGQAAQGEGYAGLPFPVNAPATAGEASSVEDQLGTSAPTVGSAVSGAGSLSGASSSAPFATSVPSTSNPASSVPVATNPGSGAEINLGPDPGIGAPGLEATPTAAQILAPILGLLPDLRSWAVPAHTSACPEPSFQLWGETYTFTSQCDLLEQNRDEIHGFFVAAFTVAALLVVLTA
ncbi:hypothetical protein [Trinickia dinghuensis]|nr:hypothetical protein [Trinickia dinghuensis]